MHNHDPYCIHDPVALRTQSWARCITRVCIYRCVHLQLYLHVHRCLDTFMYKNVGVNPNPHRSLHGTVQIRVRVRVRVTVRSLHGTVQIALQLPPLGYHWASVGRGVSYGQGQECPQSTIQGSIWDGYTFSRTETGLGIAE